MSDQALLSTLKTLGYDNQTIRRILAAADSTAVESVRATAAVHLGTELLTVQAAAGLSPRHAAQLRQVNGEIYQASGCTYRLPPKGNVDVYEVDRAIKHASLDQRMRIKAGLRALTLISA